MGCIREKNFKWHIFKQFVLKLAGSTLQEIESLRVLQTKASLAGDSHLLTRLTLELETGHGLKWSFRILEFLGCLGDSEPSEKVREHPTEKPWRLLTRRTSHTFPVHRTPFISLLDIQFYQTPQEYICLTCKCWTGSLSNCPMVWVHVFILFCGCPACI